MDKNRIQNTEKNPTELTDEDLITVSGGTNGSSLPQLSKVVEYAKSRCGYPYVWGASGPDSFDDSGLVMWCYAKIGISLPHYTEAMYSAAKQRVAVSEARPGDVLYRPGHVGISLGGGSCIHAPHAGATVCQAGGSWACALRF